MVVILSHILDEHCWRERPIADRADRQSIYLPCFIMISKRRVHREHSSCSLDEKVSIPYNRGRLVYGLFCYFLHYGTSQYRGYWLNVVAYIPRHPRCPILPSDRAGFADEPRDLQKICRVLWFTLQYLLMLCITCSELSMHQSLTSSCEDLSAMAVHGPW